MNKQQDIVLAFDTANEMIAIGVGVLDARNRAITCVASVETPAHRASNTQLLPRIDALLKQGDIARERIACVVCGRGPGSFTGVRICMATAKGMASALEVPLWGISTLDAIAWNLWDHAVRGEVAVVADAMRKEVYPVRYALGDEGVARRNADCVVKAPDAPGFLSDSFAASDGEGGPCGGVCSAQTLIVAGDALVKYADLFGSCGVFADESWWTPTGSGLLLAAQAAWRAGVLDPYDAVAGNPGLALPVYTRLSDAEENERIRLAKNDPKNLATGVQEPGLRADQRATGADVTIANAQADAAGMVYKPLDAAHAAAVACLDAQVMLADAWSEALVADELHRPDRIWWAAYDASSQVLVGYAGGWVVDGRVQILKVATDSAYRRLGIARELLARLAADARDLGACDVTLEVRALNAGAQAFYRKLGFSDIGTRPHYYADREDALIMDGPLPLSRNDVAGMELQIHNDADRVDFVDEAIGRTSKPLILAIESSCDETAAALIDGTGQLVSDVVASQIDFHARFGGVVPEIASRKHVEAICGVTQECLDVAAARLALPRLCWRDLDAVAVTYAPGLVGALVVGVAFAKAAAWGAQVPFIGVNHLEGHLYANKIATPDITPPLVVSLVSGGHTMLVHVKAWGDYEILGSTLDDAVGEAFDKVAKALGLGYPGGPILSEYAAKGNPHAIDFPRAMMHSHDLRFSLSGVKTAVTFYINKERAARRPLNIPDIAASFQQAVIEVQVAKAATALQQTGARDFCLGGGVAANPALRAAYEVMCAKTGVRLTMPPLSACTDNAGMIALVALDRFCKQQFFDLDADACAHASLDDPY
ncbi:MAG: tRNA (adenosine(37)-N6)-threonylcarbamoyltransferase complex transferase subunit TsaD [Raoultibacter sp.]